MPTANVLPNSWLIRRDTGDLTVIVNIHAIRHLASWGMTVKVNGSLVDHRMIDDPIKEAYSAIEDAIQNNVLAVA